MVGMGQGASPGTKVERMYLYVLISWSEKTGHKLMSAMSSLSFSSPPPPPPPEPHSDPGGRPGALPVGVPLEAGRAVAERAVQHAAAEGAGAAH